MADAASTTSAAAQEADDFPKRILLPAELDAFTLDAWGNVCRAAGFTVLGDADWLKDGNFTLVLSENCSAAALTRAREQYGSRRQNVRFVSSVVFTATKRSAAEGGALGPFPASLTRFRQVLSHAHLCPTALSPATKKSVALFCESLGAAFEGTYTSKVTHLIAAKALSEKYRAAIRGSKPVLTHEWVERCFRKGAVIDATLPELQVGCMVGANVCAVNLPAAQLARAKQLMTQSGGAFTDLCEEDVARLSSGAPTHTNKLRLFEQGVTHILSAHPVPGVLLDQAHTAGVPIVSFAWLEACVESRGAKYDPTAYPVRNPAEEELEREAARERAKEAADKEAAEAAAVAAREAARVAEEQSRVQAELQEAERLARADSERRKAEVAARQQAALDEEERTRAVAAAESSRAIALKDAPGEVVYDPRNDDYFSSLTVILFALDSKAQEETLIDIVRFGGGTRLLSPAGRESALHAYANAHCAKTVLVCGSFVRRDTLEEKLRVECANRTLTLASFSMPCVTHRWLEECHRLKEIVPYEPYLLPATSASDPQQTNAPTPSNARGVSPHPTVSVPGLTRTTSLNRSMAIHLARSDSRAATRMGDSSAVEGGAADFSAFNAQLPGGSKSGLPPASDASAAGRVQPALLKMAYSGAPVGVAALFRNLMFCVEAADDDDDAPEGEPAHPLRALCFTAQRRLTVLKQLTDFGAESSNVLEPTQIRSAKVKDSLSYVIGGVCGSSAATAKAFQTRYGSKAVFASHFWVAACIKQERLLPLEPPNLCWSGMIPRSLLPHKAGARGAAQQPSPAPLPEFAVLNLSGSGFSSDETDVLSALALHAGAQFTHSFNSNNTHLLYNEAGNAGRKPGASSVQTKLQLAARLGVPVVQPEWLLACITQRAMLDEKDFALSAELLASVAPAVAASSRRASSREIPVPQTSVSHVDTPVQPVPSLAATVPTAADPAPVVPARSSASTTGPAPPPTLPASAFAPPRSRGRNSPELAEGEIPSQLAEGADGGGVGGGDADDDDDLGSAFIKNIVANKFVKAGAPSPAPVRSKRAAGKQAKSAAVASPVTPAPAPAAAPVSVISDSDEVAMVEGGAPAAAAPAEAPKHSSAKAAFLASSKGAASRSSRGRRSGAAAHVSDDEDAGEAEAQLLPLLQRSAAASAAAVDVIKTPLKTPTAVASDAASPAFDSDEDAPVAAAPAAPVVSPFKRKPNATLQNAASTLVTPKLLAKSVEGTTPVSGSKKTFVKKKAGRGAATPPTTPPASSTAEAGPKFRASRASTTAAAAAAATAEAASVIDVDEASSSEPELATPAQKRGGKGKRVRRRIIADDDEEGGDGGNDDGSAAAEGQAQSEAERASEAVPMEIDQDQPGSQRKPAKSSSKRTKVALASSAPKSKGARSRSSRGAAAKRSSDEDASAVESHAEGEEAEEEKPAAAKSSKRKSVARSSAVKPSPIAEDEDEDEVQSSGSLAESDGDEWRAESASAAAVKPSPATTRTRPSRAAATTASPAASTSTRTPRSTRPRRGAAKEAIKEVSEESSDAETESEVEAAKKPEPPSSSRKKTSSKKQPDAVAIVVEEAEPAEPVVAAAEPAPVQPAAAPASPISPIPLPAGTIAKNFAKRTPPPGSKLLASPTPAAAPASKTKRQPAVASNAPMRSDSLGGGPVPSLADVEAAERKHLRSLRVPKGTLSNVLHETASQTADPFEFALSEDEGRDEPAAAAPPAPAPAAGATTPAKAATQLTDTQTLSAAPDAPEEPVPAKSKSKSAKPPAAAAAPKQPVVELSDSQPTPPASPSASAKKGAKKGATPAAARSKRGTAAAAPAEPEQPAAEATEEPLMETATAATPRGRKAAKRKHEETAVASPPPAADARITRTPSTKAALSLSELHQEAAAEEEEAAARKKARIQAASGKGAAESPVQEGKASTPAAPAAPAASSRASKSKTGAAAVASDSGSQTAQQGEQKTEPRKGKRKAAPVGEDVPAAAVDVAAADAAPAEEEKIPSPLKRAKGKAAAPVADVAEAAPAPKTTKSKRMVASAEDLEEMETADNEERKEPPPPPAARARGASSTAASSKPAKAAASSSPVPRVLTLTGLTSADKPLITKQIESLGHCTLVDEPDYNTLTHVVSGSNSGVVKRSEKLLVGLCSGAFLLTDAYVTESAKAGRWLDEAPFEWHKRAQTDDPLKKGLQHWHRAGPHARQAYAGWRVLLDVPASSTKAEGFKRMLTQGGATLLPKGADAAQVTHLLVECEARTPAEFARSGGKQHAAALALVARHPHPEQLQVARTDFIVERLRLDSIEPYLLLAPAASAAAAVNAPSRKASQGSKASQVAASPPPAGARKASQGAANVAAPAASEEDDAYDAYDRTVRQRRGRK